jgi:hypothetical protein
MRGCLVVEGQNPTKECSGKNQIRSPRQSRTIFSQVKYFNSVEDLGFGDRGRKSLGFWLPLEPHGYTGVWMRSHRLRENIGVDDNHALFIVVASVFGSTEVDRLVGRLARRNLQFGSLDSSLRQTASNGFVKVAGFRTRPRGDRRFQNRSRFLFHRTAVLSGANAEFCFYGIVEFSNS